jgi:hypothetical protein
MEKELSTAFRLIELAETAEQLDRVLQAILRVYNAGQMTNDELLQLDMAVIDKAAANDWRIWH